MKTKIFLLILFFLIFNFPVIAQERGRIVDYADDLVLDSDLDGLTNAGEQQIFGTDIQNPDSDGDGLLDGAEVLSGFDPLNKEYVSFRSSSAWADETTTPWVWFSVRALGIVGFLLLYGSIFFGLFIRIPPIARLIRPSVAVDYHRWFSLQAIIFCFFHGLLLVFDSFYAFNLKDVFFPFYSSFNTAWLSLGIISFYLMIVLIASSYLRAWIPRRLWRAIHYLNIFLYTFGSLHAYFLGTDIKLPTVKFAFFLLNIILFVLVLVNIGYRAKRELKLANPRPEINP